MLLLVSLLAAGASAQWLETTIPIGGWPEAICYNSANNRVYCESQGDSGYAIVVIDGATNLIVAEVAVEDDIFGLCYNPAANKIYCSYWNDAVVSVICGAGDTVITNTSVQDSRWVMCCDSARNKMYCVGDTGTVTVICGTGDTVLASLRVGSAGRSVSVSPDHGKVLCGMVSGTDLDTLVVFDCDSDSVVARLRVYEEPTEICYNPANGCAYCLADYDQAMSVVDCATNQPVTLIDVGYGQASVCCAPAENKLFCTTYNGGMFVIDARSNTVVDSLQLSSSTGELFCNPLNDKVYCASYYGDSTVTVVDAATNAVLMAIEVGVSPIGFAHNPVQNRVYVANFGDSSISVIRDSGGGVTETMKDKRATMNAGPTVVRGALMLDAVSIRQNAGCRAELLDISGRNVLDLHPGVNDVRALPPGVYFVREAQAQAVHKVVLTW